MSNSLRAFGRRNDQLRDIKISYNVFGYAPGSVLFELGNTKILCSVTMAPGVPPFLKGTKTGWLTAEYAMIPTACQNRLTRESSQLKRNDRAVEISRLIGRSLRAVVDLSLLGERTIHIDCDVLQADGSTRTASISGAYIALKMAVDCWLSRGDITTTILTDAVAAVSVGARQGQSLLDLDYAEDSAIDADYNFVLTQSERIIEIQGSAEKKTLSWQEFDKLKELAIAGNKQLFTLMEKSLFKAAVPLRTINNKTDQLSQNAPLFSLKNRLINA